MEQREVCHKIFTTLGEGQKETKSNSGSQVYVAFCPYTTGSWETHDVSLREGSVEQAGARQLPCQSRQSTNGVSSVACVRYIALEDLETSALAGDSIVYFAISRFEVIPHQIIVRTRHYTEVEILRVPTSNQSRKYCPKTRICFRV